MEYIKGLIFGIMIFVITASLALLAGFDSIIFLGYPLIFYSVVFVFLIQWIIFIPSYYFKTEQYFDLSGGFTFIIVIWLTYYFSNLTGNRSIILIFLVTIWALRISLFLFIRIKLIGEDKRFDEIKFSISKYFITWNLQAMWISITLLPVLVVLTTDSDKPIGLLDIIGLFFWIAGFTIECVADYQKFNFKKNKANQGNFISSGLWSWSRHPNYFGEIVLWIGITLISISVFYVWQWIALVSPIFVILLLTQISGIPILEKKADEKWGDQVSYLEYKEKTSLLVIKPPRK